ncbi:unnamed protein product [Protopolystoma xenopodis]|uniref:Uncharacterized protein n=1 Tax=Protopolystoma xenopodis TaxID=117903 RepID=A0A3S5C762_9PLAT|nr:unnamed protein product [Protopolystoma xenopodis]
METLLEPSSLAKSEARAIGGIVHLHACASLMHPGRRQRLIWPGNVCRSDSDTKASGSSLPDSLSSLARC